MLRVKLCRLAIVINQKRVAERSLAAPTSRNHAQRLKHTFQRVAIKLGLQLLPRWQSRGHLVQLRQCGIFGIDAERRSPSFRCRTPTPLQDSVTYKPLNFARQGVE